ncbi:hypothetical protein MED121_07305 [Marinomonas sp. MED121]|uniref:DUF7217 family protein n=1 Tax=Marinomonas sp. MED121 TaxID=314277 RepID=UPI00006903BF|nr:hypothetical protein [Marinomonas sp. MED121]EAQ66472.1 hypothetical protein MED121_07305 [Marinomonas sp. MED121]
MSLNFNKDIFNAFGQGGSFESSTTAISAKVKEKAAQVDAKIQTTLAKISDELTPNLSASYAGDLLIAQASLLGYQDGVLNLQLHIESRISGFLEDMQVASAIKEVDSYLAELPASCTNINSISGTLAGVADSNLNATYDLMLSFEQSLDFLEQNLAALESELTHLEEGINGEVNELKSSLESLETELTQLETNINEAEAKLDKIKTDLTQFEQTAEESLAAYHEAQAVSLANYQAQITQSKNEYLENLDSRLDSSLESYQDEVNDYEASIAASTAKYEEELNLSLASYKASLDEYQANLMENISSTETQLLAYQTSLTTKLNDYEIKLTEIKNLILLPITDDLTQFANGFSSQLKSLESVLDEQVVYLANTVSTEVNNLSQMYLAHKQMANAFSLQSLIKDECVGSLISQFADDKLKFAIERNVENLLGDDLVQALEEDLDADDLIDDYEAAKEEVETELNETIEEIESNIDDFISEYDDLVDQVKNQATAFSSQFETAVNDLGNELEEQADTLSNTLDSLLKSLSNDLANKLALVANIENAAVNFKQEAMLALTELEEETNSAITELSQAMEALAQAIEANTQTLEANLEEAVNTLDN